MNPTCWPKSLQKKFSTATDVLRMQMEDLGITEFAIFRDYFRYYACSDLTGPVKLEYKPFYYLVDKALPLYFVLSDKYIDARRAMVALEVFKWGIETPSFLFKFFFTPSIPFPKPIDPWFFKLHVLSYRDYAKEEVFWEQFKHGKHARREELEKYLSTVRDAPFPIVPKEYFDVDHYGYFKLLIGAGLWEEANNSLEPFFDWHDWLMDQKPKPRYITYPELEKPVNFFGALKHWFRGRQADTDKEFHGAQSKMYFYQCFADHGLDLVNSGFDTLILLNMMRIDLGIDREATENFVRAFKPLIMSNADIYAKAEALGVEYEPTESISPNEINAWLSEAQNEAVERRQKRTAIRIALAEAAKDEEPCGDSPSYSPIDLVLGILSDEDDPKYPAKRLRALNALLTAAGHPKHDEPNDLERETAELSLTAMDELKKRAGEKPHVYQHLLNFELDQYIVPIDFEKVLLGGRKKKLPFDAFLSSYTLQRELASLGSEIGLDMELLARDKDAFDEEFSDLTWEQQAVVTLFELCAASIETDGAIWVAG